MNRTPSCPPSSQYWPGCGILGHILGIVVLAAGLSGAPIAADPRDTDLAVRGPVPRPSTAGSDGLRPARLAPDYADVVIPPNLAPLNLTIQEAGIEFEVSIAGDAGAPLELRQASPQIRFPIEAWRTLLAANRGGALRWAIRARESGGDWVAFAPVQTRVAGEPIDPYVFYRRLQPLYSTYKRLGIYQRHLETFEERPVLRNAALQQGCVNCHTFAQGSPDRFAISLRGRFGTPTLLVESNRVTRVPTKMGYLTWHPNGQVLAFAANEITQFFHVAGPRNRDVHDARSDLAILRVDTGQVEKPAALSAPDVNENWPYWAPDGRHLYFCSGRTARFEDVGSFRYDLRRIPYDPDRHAWGPPETLVSGAAIGRSLHQPRPSPDGRFLVLTVSEFGSFPLFRPESDLMLLRLDTRELEPLPALNSEHAETWHSWSSNGRWLVFGSRRLDGVFARIHISYFDAAARFTRPLILPQEDPAYYDTCLDNFNVPELARGPIAVSEEQLARAALGSGAPPAPTPRDPTHADEYPGSAMHTEGSFQ